MSKKDRYLNYRWKLTILWILFFLSALMLCESYIHTKRDEIYFITSSERIIFIKSLSILYSPYIGGIIAFWFIKPFNEPKTEVAAKLRFRLALILTLIFNILLLFILAQAYFSEEVHIVDDIDSAVKIGGILSFLVGPVNAFYFGTKTSD